MNKIVTLYYLVLILFIGVLLQGYFKLPTDPGSVFGIMLAATLPLYLYLRKQEMNHPTNSQD